MVRELDKFSGSLDAGDSQGDFADFEEQTGEEELSQARSESCDEQNPLLGVKNRRKGMARSKAIEPSSSSVSTTG